MEKGERSYFLAGQARALGLLVGNESKPLACLDSSLSQNEIDDIQFMAPIIKNIQRVNCAFWLRNYRNEMYCLYIYRDGNEAILTDLQELIRDFKKLGKYSKKEYHIKLGRLFGYSDLAIRKYTNKYKEQEEQP